MDLKLDSRMLEAMRLTRTGRLMEATDVIQALLGGDRKTAGRPSAETSPSSTLRAPLVIDGTAERIEDDAEQPPRKNVSGISADRTAKAAETAGARSSASRRHGFATGTRPLGATTLPSFARGRRQRPSTPVEIPAGARFLSGHYRCDAGARDYKLYVPSGYSSSASMPLVVMLHGCTQSANDFATGTQMNALAEEHGFLVAYPVQAKSANGSGCWNWFKAADQRRDGGEPAIIAGIMRTNASDYAIDPDRIYVAGLSAGGAAAAIMGAAYPDIYAAVGVHSGLPAGAATDLATAFAAMRQGARETVATVAGTAIVPTIVFHGAQDTTVHPSNGDFVIEQTLSGRMANLKTETRHGRTAAGRTFERTCKLDAEGRSIVEMWLLDGVGHAWSGGHAAGSYTDPDGPPASREMVRFFMQHRRSVTPSK